MKKAAAIIVLIFLVGNYTVAAQEITMFSVISISKSDINKSNEYLLANHWKPAKTVKVEAHEIQDPHGRFAHFTNCYFMLPEYKKKLKPDHGNKNEGVFRDAYNKGQDSIFLYYYNVGNRQYPAGVLYKTNRVKLTKIEDYLKHNKYAQTFERDSTLIYEIKHSVENVTIDKSNNQSIEYYIDRCWKFADQHRIME